MGNIYGNLESSVNSSIDGGVGDSANGKVLVKSGIRFNGLSEASGQVGGDGPSAHSGGNLVSASSISVASIGIIPFSGGVGVSN